MSTNLPVEQVVRCVSLEFKREVWQSLNLGIFGIKMMLIALRLEYTTMRKSRERKEDKGRLP